jgi:hypothetical protein
MSYVITTPEMMTSAAADLATIGSNLAAAHTAAATPTLAVLPAAADEVSASIAQLFSAHAANYQATAAQAVAFNDQFVQHLTAGAFSYANIEAALAALLQAAPGFVSFITNTPQQQLLQFAEINLLAILFAPAFFTAAGPTIGLILLALLYEAFLMYA